MVLCCRELAAIPRIPLILKKSFLGFICIILRFLFLFWKARLITSIMLNLFIALFFLSLRS